MQSTSLLVLFSALYSMYFLNPFFKLVLVDAVETGTSPQSQHDKSAAKLKALVGSVDSGAVSAVLLPLRSAMGLCILILIDKVDEVPHDKHEPAQ